jgi:hypothetical protein
MEVVEECQNAMLPAAARNNCNIGDDHYPAQAEK